MFRSALISLTLLASFHQSSSQLSEGVSPWGCGRFTYYNATWNEAEVPGIIDQALFEVDNYLEYLYTVEGVPSISFGIVYGNNLIHYYSIGNSDLNDSNSEPTEDTIYRIGSISKVWTTLMAFIMRDEGIVSFDTPVSHYNSNFSVRNPWGVNSEEKLGQRITLKHLASQVSGLPREAPCLNATDDGICSLEDTNTILERLSKYFYLIHPTDVQASYSNLAYALLGNIVAEYANLTFEEALDKYVIDPLGATHTGLYLDSDQSKYAAVGYYDGVEQGWYDLGWEGPAGQVFSSVTDLSKLISQYFASIPGKYSLNDNSYIDNNGNDNFNFITYPTTFREMLRMVFINPDLETGFGSPWEMQSMNNGGMKTWIKSKGGNVNGFSSNIAMIPEMRLGAIGLVNDEVDGSLFTFGPIEILYKAFNAWLVAMESEYKPQLPSNPDIYEGDYYYAGTYLFSIELTKLNQNSWLMLYGFSSGVYGTIVPYSNDTTGSTFIYVDTQSTNVLSCWTVTLTALDGTTLLFDISQNSVTGVELIDNEYGETFSNGDSNTTSSSMKSYYLNRQPKRSHKTDKDSNRYDLRKEKNKQHEDISNILRRNHPLQMPLSGKRKRSSNVGRNVRPNTNRQFGGYN